MLATFSSGGATEHRFSAADEACCHFDQSEAPNTVHFEVRVPGTLDRERLRRAVAEALTVHDRYRACRVPPGRFARHYSWRVADAFDVDPYTFTEAKDAEALAAARRACFGTTPSIERSPALRVLHVAGPNGDFVMVNAHHAVLDGRSTAEFLRVVADRYSGSSRTPASNVARQASDNQAVDNQASDNLVDAGAVAGRRLARPMHLAASGGGASGYGFDFIDLPAASIRPARVRGVATVNDVLVVALAAATLRWNARAGRKPRSIARITVPIGGADDPSAAPGNDSQLRSAEVPLALMSGGRDGLRAAVSAVRTQIAAARAAQQSQLGAIAPVFASGALPVALKAALVRPATRLAGAWQSTAVVSNLGALREVEFGAAADLQVEAVGFSAPARMPRGIFIGAVGHRGVVHICLRHNTALFDAAAGRRFADEYRNAIGEVADAVASSVSA
jgi:hypothetical protein